MQAIMEKKFSEKERERCAEERTTVEGLTPMPVPALPSPSGHKSSCVSGGTPGTPILDDASLDLDGIKE